MAYNGDMAKRDDDLEFSINAAFDEARTIVDKVPLYLVNGSLGAGKTSVLEFLLRQRDYKGARVIENEYANENVDGYRLEGLADMVTFAKYELMQSFYVIDAYEILRGVSQRTKLNCKRRM